MACVEEVPGSRKGPHSTEDVPFRVWSLADPSLFKVPTAMDVFEAGL